MDRIDRTMVKVMPDGTEKHVNPFTGTEVWFIPGRKNRPIFTGVPATAKRIERRQPEDYCNFCPAHYLNTPPEKARMILRHDQSVMCDRPQVEEVLAETALFRRIGNLFEIVTIDYWKKNFNYMLTEKNRTWKERYLSTEQGRAHVFAIVDMKLKYSGIGEEEIKNFPVDKKIVLADAFFGGCHELVIPSRHYTDGAEWDTQLAASGELTSDEHYHYFRFTIAAMNDIHDNNRYVRYIAVYQNWLKEAGASFDHMHKQLCGLDEWGVSLEAELNLAYRNPNMYNEYAANYAAYNNYVLCENEHAVAFVDLGHRHPTIAIYSKSINCRPSSHSDEELRGFSDIVHAVYAATGTHISCNEEWYYRPFDSTIPIPWHILIKWRVNIAAGFEGGTKIYVNPMSLTELRDSLVPRLFELRSQGRFGYLLIAEECPVRPNSLKYYKNDFES
jgi:galactose-1-phosphate uridylyltransferase